MAAVIIVDPAYQYYVSVEGHSWATFTFSDKGDFTINSDWGYWCCNWRSFGADFKKFLKEINTHYLISNLLRQQIQFGGKKSIYPRAEEAITVLFKEFQQQLWTTKN